jgi:hypothetical protein
MKDGCALHFSMASLFEVLEMCLVDRVILFLRSKHIKPEIVIWRHILDMPSTLASELRH